MYVGRHIALSLLHTATSRGTIDFGIEGTNFRRASEKSHSHPSKFRDAISWPPKASTFPSDLQACIVLLVRR